MAECSLSTGRIRTCFSSASGMIICPAVTRVSLLASAISLPASMAAMVGRIPIMPTTAVTTISASSAAAASISPSIPEVIVTGRSETFSFSSLAFSSLHTQATLGLNSRICCSRSSILLPAARETTLISELARTTSRVCVPMEPVEPRTAICFIFHLIPARKRAHCHNTFCSIIAA